MKKEISITSAEQLHELKLLVKQFKKIELKLSYLNDSENETWEKLINKEYFNCGCATGSYFAGIGILLTLIYLVYAFAFGIPISIKMVLVLVVGMAILGKLIGLLLAHIRLLRIIQLLGYLKFNKVYESN